MSFLSNLGADALIDDGGYDNSKIPLGTHIADVVKVRVDEQKESVGLQVKFREFGAFKWFNLNFLGKTPEKTQIAKKMSVKQLKNAGNEIKTEADVAKAIENIDGAGLKITVSKNRNHDQFQNFFISGNVPRVRVETQDNDDLTSSNTDDLPF